MNNLLEQNAQNKNMLPCSQWLWSYMILKPGQRGQLTVYLLTKIGLLQLWDDDMYFCAFVPRQNAPRWHEEPSSQASNVGYLCNPG